VAPKLSEVTENINEVMPHLEKQADSELLHLLHLTNIKQYVLKQKKTQSTVPTNYTTKIFS
jgi:hypothetical protein